MDWVLDNRIVLINVAYLIAAVCFIVGLKLLSSPATARRGNQIAALGMAIAVVATLFMPGLHNLWLILVGLAIGAVLAVYVGRVRHVIQGRFFDPVSEAWQPEAVIEQNSTGRGLNPVTIRSTRTQ